MLNDCVYVQGSEKMWIEKPKSDVIWLFRHITNKKAGVDSFFKFKNYTTHMYTQSVYEFCGWVEFPSWFLLPSWQFSELGECLWGKLGKPKTAGRIIIIPPWSESFKSAEKPSCPTAAQCFCSVQRDDWFGSDCCLIERCPALRWWSNAWLHTPSSHRRVKHPKTSP